MSEKHFLKHISSPNDIKQLNHDELKELCQEIREELIETVSQTGGHLASNLGVVELTVAMHKVFHSPQDQFVFDVGHQAYTHKLLTGRYQDFYTLRTENGISGFTRPVESEHDIFSSGHSSTSISAACGLARARSIRQDKGYVVAVIGDGALTGGLAYEGLNNAARGNDHLIVILNDNKMSISKNVGAMARYLAVMRSSPKYYRLKTRMDRFISKIPLIGKPLAKGIFMFKDIIKGILYNSTFFEDMGFRYLGPFDGHDIPLLTEALENAKHFNKAVLIHVNTVKGKGYDFAEKNPTQFHGVSQFDIQSGEPIHSGTTYSSCFGNALIDFAGKDSRVCAITAAMPSGTGLDEFAKLYPKRFFDVGIAEGHAVTFASGLARNGMLPVFAVYSTFLQRCYDQLIHDGAMQRQKLILAIDRAGFVGEDGESHQGVFDIPMMYSVPDLVIYSPSSFDELSNALFKAFYKEKGMVAIRYPRGVQRELPAGIPSGEDYFLYEPVPASIVLVTFGRLFSDACKAQKALQAEGVSIKVLKLNKIKPVPAEAAAAVLNAETVYFFEESIRSGGVGEHFAALLLEKGYRGSFHHIAVNDRFIHQASVQRQLHKYQLDCESMIEIIAGRKAIDCEAET